MLQRRYGMPLYATAKTYRASRAKLGDVEQPVHFRAGAAIEFGGTVVQTIPTAHDGADGVAFVVMYGGKRLGIFTDLGHRFPGIADWLNGLDGLYLESNYDPQMLRTGPYPAWLKHRIVGSKGHLSNVEAAELVGDGADRLQLLVLAHLSEHNNCPELALETARALAPADLPIVVASRTCASEMFVV